MANPVNNVDIVAAILTYSVMQKLSNDNIEKFAPNNNNQAIKTNPPLNYGQSAVKMFKQIKSDLETQE